MEKTGGCSKGSESTPGTKRTDDDCVFFKILGKSQRKFHLKMKEIFIKYNQPFENDVVVYMEDLTYDTPRGRLSWIDEPPVSENGIPEVANFKNCNISANGCEEPQLTVPKDEPVSGQTSTAQVKRENPDDCKGFTSTSNSALTVFNKTINVTSPLKITVSNLESFVDMDNTKVLVKYPERNCAAFFKADEREAAPNEETCFFEPLNTTLEDVYPQMVENMINIWNIDMKTKAAFNILRHYRRQIKCKQKFKAMIRINGCMNKTYTVHHAPRVAKPGKALDHTMLQGGCSSRPALGDPVGSQNPSLFLHKLGRPVVSCTYRHLSKSKSIKMFEPTVNNPAAYRDMPLPGKLHKEEDYVMAICNPSETLSDIYEIFESMTEVINNRGQMDVAIAKSSYGKDQRQQHTDTLRRRKSFSEISLWHSPKNKVAKANYNMSEMTRSLSSYLTSPSLLVIDERAPGSYKAHTEKVARTRSLTRRNSFSAFPGAHSPDFTLGKAKVQFSSTISSLGTSPGSVRAKRPLSHDLSSLIPKKYRSATDAIVNTLKPSSHGNPKSSECNSTLSHSAIASSLPAHMWHQSAGSQRFVSLPKNARSPKRTNARLYRTLTYQEDDD